MHKSGSEPSPGLNSALKPLTLSQISLCIRCGAQWDPCKSLDVSLLQKALNLSKLKFLGEEPQS